MSKQSNALKVTTYRRRIKQSLVKAFGDKCYLCGSEFNSWIFELHHIDPSTKLFAIAGEGITRSKDKCALEAKKCVMLCANCHRELEHGGRTYKLVSNFDIEVFYNTMSELTGESERLRKAERLAVKKSLAKKGSPLKPDRDTLKALIRDTPFTQIGNMFGVSDNAIRLWATSYGLPSKVSDITSLSDSEWDCC